MDYGVETSTSTVRKRLLEVGHKTTRPKTKVASNSENDEKMFSNDQKILIKDI